MPGSFFKIVLLSCALVLGIFTREAHALDYSVHGFLQGNYSADVDSPNPDDEEFKWAEERAQFKLEASEEPFRLFVKTDLFFDHLDEDAEVELREAYFDVTQPKWDLRIGRQIITWGLGDLVFINDTFPKDYMAFFSGRPLEYLKKGADSVKAGFYPEIASFELVLTPFFEPNNFPDPDRFWTFDPMPGVTNRVQREPAVKIENTEAALRVYRDMAGFNVSVYAYKGFYREPSITAGSLLAPTRIEFVYPRLAVYGLSLQRGALGGVAGFEAGYYDSLEDKSGTDPLVPNAESRFLVSYQRQIIEDFSVTLQYYGEYAHKYAEYERTLPIGFPKERQFTDLASLRMTYLLLHQNMRLQWFSFWSPVEMDYLLNPEVKYNFSDHIWAAVGANIFGGKDGSKFGSLDRNDNAYLQARYEF